jgi:hypothetical protein
MRRATNVQCNAWGAAVMASARTIPVLLGAAGLMAAMMLPARASVLHHLSVRPHVQFNMPLQFGLRPHPFHDSDLTPRCETVRPPKKAAPRRRCIAPR